jgi:hypothetical protein
VLYRFKSKNAGDVIMLEPNGRQVLEIIGKTAGPQGIILATQMPQALAALRVAIAQDEEEERERHRQMEIERKAQCEDAAAVHQPPGVSLRHRALPFMQMLEFCHQLGDDVVWGV